MTTTGQRIAAKRKELGLSQEALGEKLGVSRQSIYKWESDTSLPEIEKLISLSRLFSVPVGWLLGVEEVSENQEQLIEDILSRYPSPKKSPWAGWAIGGLAVLCAAALAAVFSLSGQVKDIKAHYNFLTAQYNSVSMQVSNQTNILTHRMEEILAAQNHLTADYTVEQVRTSPADNTVTFAVQVVPKTYTEGMEVLLLANNGNGAEEFPVAGDGNLVFSREITCGLTDKISISAAFATPEGRQTQLLDTFTNLYRDSFEGCRPKWNGYVELVGRLAEEDGLFHFGGESFQLYVPSGTSPALEVALFQDQKLICYLEKAPYESTEPGDSGQIYTLPEVALDIPQGGTLTIAAFYKDEYGRSGVEPLIPRYVREENMLNYASGDYHFLYDLSSYVF